MNLLRVLLRAPVAASVIVAMLAGCAASPGAAPGPSTAVPPAVAPAREVTEITFPARDGRMLKAVVSVPTGKGPFPVLVTVHGGQGDRGFEVLRNVADPASDSPVVQMFNRNPWIVFAPGYRNDWFGAEETDLVDAIRHASRLPGADPSRVAVYGGSNGGRLTLRAATLEPKLMKCVGAGSPFMAHPPYLFGDVAQPPWSLTSPAAQAWMGRTRELLRPAVTRAAARSGKSEAKLLEDHSAQVNAALIRTRVLLLTSRADEQVPHVMLEGLIAALARAGNPAEVLTVDKSLHGFYWGREGEFGARAGRGNKTPEQLREEERTREVVQSFLGRCLAGR